MVFLVLSTATGVFFTYYYVKFGRMIDQRFKGPVFGNSARIYAIPHAVQVGEKIEPKEIAAELRHAGYTDQGEGKSPMGSYRLFEGGIEIKPGTDSYHSQESAIIRVRGGKVENIVSQGGQLAAYELEPQMITSLFDAEQRSKRQLVKYDEIPPLLVNAVLAIEDRRFFQHGGVNFIRLAEATWVDITHQRHEQGGSTITMQLSRAFFLTPEKTVKRKLSEMMIALEMEQKFSKQQIFEFYANRVDLGQRGSFTISGFAQAAQAYFNKDLKDLSPAEAALIAGIIQAPSYLSPYRHPERALERRNLVLDSMVDTHAITQADAEKAKATPLKLAPPNVEASDAPYFVDLLRETLISKLDERQMNDQGYRIYTTLDPELQRAAAAAVQTGMKLVDEQVTKLRTKRTKVGKNKYETKVLPGPQAQVALVVIDPHTGEILALVGGRNYGMSQLNHAVAKRPTGSIFKPFVYAAAMNTATGWFQPGVHPGFHSAGCAWIVCLRRPDLRAAQLQRGVSRRRDRALRTGNVIEQRDRQTGGGSGLRKSGRPGESGWDHIRESHSRHGIGRLRCHPHGHGGSVHSLRQRRDTNIADPGQLGAQRKWRCRPRFQTGNSRRARSTGGLRDDRL